MVVSDRLLTMITGTVLAIGGGAASIFLGGEDHVSDQPLDSVVIAKLSAPSVPEPKKTLHRPVFDDLAAQDIPGSLRTENRQPEGGVERDEGDLVFAAIEPPKRLQSARVGTDLAQIAVLEGVRELAEPADFSEILMTRSFATVPAPYLTRVAAAIPTLSVDIPSGIVLPKTATLSCGLEVRATPISGARVTLKLAAPCHPNVAVTIEHGGLRFKEQLDGNGQLVLKVPVFAEYSRFNIQLADGTKSTVGAYIAGLSQIERVGMGWEGANDTFLHAFHNGAKTSDPGHIWRLNTGSFATSRMEGGGYMMVLGNPELKDAELAQVFTLPTAKKERAQVVSLEVETLRTEEMCDAAFRVDIAQHHTKSGAANSTLKLLMPACGSQPGNLVLKNVFKDMKVARK